MKRVLPHLDPPMPQKRPSRARGGVAFWHGCLGTPLPERLTVQLALARRCGFVALLVGVGSFAVSGLGRAQAPADKAALIRRLLALTKAADLAVTAMEASIPAQRAANPRIPKEFWDEFTARARRDMPRFIDMLVPVYDSHFSKPQLEQLLAFYESPLGRHLTKVQPEITVQSAQAGQKWGAELGAAVAQDLAKRGVKMPEQ